MALSDVRTLVIAGTGRKDWETSTTEMDDFILRGQRWLDGTQETPHSKRRYLTRIFPGDVVIPVPDIRAIFEVWLYNTDGRIKLIKEEREDLFVAYGKFLPPLIGSDLITNGRFDGGSTGWTLNANWTYENNYVVHAAGSAATLVQTIAPIDSGDFRLIVEMSSRTAGTVTPSLTGTNGIAIGANGLNVQTITITTAPTDLTFTPSSDFVGRIDSVTLCRIINVGDTADSGVPTHWAPNITTLAPSQLLFDVSDLEQRNMAQDVILGVFNKRGILIHPPSDAVFDVNVVGQFYSNPLVAASDTSYWSEEYPEVLALAAQYIYEIHFRNNAGARAVRSLIADLLEPIDSGLIFESVHDISNIEG